MSKEVHGEGVASGSHTPSRIARPISPGLKASHGVSGSNSGIPMTSKLAQPSSSSGLSNGSAGMGGASKRNAGEWGRESGAWLNGLAYCVYIAE